MKHARDDYNRIQDPDNKIPADMPVMLFLAKDENFAEVCAFYAGLLLTKYGVRKLDMAMLVLKHAQLATRWPSKEPDL